MDEWQEVALDDVAILNGGFAFKSTQYTESGRFVLRTVNITDDYAITKEGATFISEKEAVDYGRFCLQEHDTLFVMVAATLGKVGYVRSKDLPALLNQNMWVIRARADKIEPIFLHYAFREISKIPLSWVSGSARSFLRRDDVRTLRFKLPPVPEQKAIADTLAALDDKIELNRRMNETLEGMAQAIFRDWFVDFGPVRRQAAGATDSQAIMGGLTTDPAQAATLAALFPAAFGPDGLPVGWSRQTVESVIELAYGKSLPKTVRKDGPFPVYGSGGISGTHSTALVIGPGIIVGRKGTVGSLYWEPGDFFAIDTVFYVVPKAGIPLNFAWHLLKTLGLEGMNTDAAVPGLNRGNAYRLEFAFGGAALLDAFELFVGPLRARQNTSSAETQTLAETRDYLLPRLMSGAVRVVSQVEAA